MSALTKFKQSPWAWVSTLYFIEGIPYFLVNEISVIFQENGSTQWSNGIIYKSYLSSLGNKALMEPIC